MMLYNYTYKAISTSFCSLSTVLFSFTPLIADASLVVVLSVDRVLSLILDNFALIFFSFVEVGIHLAG